MPSQVEEERMTTNTDEERERERRMQIGKVAEETVSRLSAPACTDSLNGS